MSLRCAGTLSYQRTESSRLICGTYNHGNTTYSTGACSAITLPHAAKAVDIESSTATCKP